MQLNRVCTVKKLYREPITPLGLGFAILAVIRKSTSTLLLVQTFCCFLFLALSGVLGSSHIFIFNLPWNSPCGPPVALEGTLSITVVWVSNHLLLSASCHSNLVSN